MPDSPQRAKRQLRISPARRRGAVNGTKESSRAPIFLTATPRVGLSSRARKSGLPIGTGHNRAQDAAHSPTSSPSSHRNTQFDKYRRRRTAMSLLSHKAHLFFVLVGAAALSATTTKQRVTLGRVRPIVAPSVAKANFLALGAELEACTAAGCEWLHCSVQDGVFVPKVSFGHRPVSICYQRVRELMNPCAGAPVVAAARKACPDTVIDVKLGCIDPENRVAEFAAAGADAISFHPEATKQPMAVAHRIRDAGVAPGIVLNPGTAVASVAPLLGLVDLAVVMLVSPGYGGPKYTELAVATVWNGSRRDDSARTRRKILISTGRQGQSAPRAAPGPAHLCRRRRQREDRLRVTTRGRERARRGRRHLQGRRQKGGRRGADRQRAAQAWE
jgi:ribulose-phosphate 3-epimerase